MPDRLAGFDNAQVQRIGSMLKWYENIGRYLDPEGAQVDSHRPKVPMFLAKASGSVADGGSGNAVIWSTTSNSTAAEATKGTSVTWHSWGGVTASSGDALILVPHSRSGHLYGFKPNPTPAADNAIAAKLTSNENLTNTGSTFAIEAVGTAMESTDAWAYVDDANDQIVFRENAGVVAHLSAQFTNTTPSTVSVSERLQVTAGTVTVYGVADWYGGTHTFIDPQTWGTVVYKEVSASDTWKMVGYRSSPTTATVWRADAITMLTLQKTANLD